MLCFRKACAGMQASRAFSTSGARLVKSTAYEDLGQAALAQDIPTVDLAYDLHQAPGHRFASHSPIVFLHGLFGSKSNNRTVSRRLARELDRDVYCLDLRNHGESPHDSRMDYPAMSADVEHFIEKHSLKTPVLIGHSMGAKAAMAVTLRKPKLCSLLIPVDNAPIDYTAGGSGFSKFGMYVRQLKKIEATRSLTSLKECDQILAEVEQDVTVRQFLLTNVKRRPDGDGYYSRVPLDILGKNLDNISGWPFNYHLSRWSGPTDFIRGTKSAHVVDEYLAQIGMFFPRFQVDDVEAGHWLISEKPDQFLTDVGTFVQFQEDE